MFPMTGTIFLSKKGEKRSDWVQTDLGIFCLGVHSVLSVGTEPSLFTWHEKTLKNKRNCKALNVINIIVHKQC